MPIESMHLIEKIDFLSIEEFRQRKIKIEVRKKMKLGAFLGAKLQVLFVIKRPWLLRFRCKSKGR
jgi:hypothetical protein